MSLERFSDKSYQILNLKSLTTGEKVARILHPCFLKTKQPVRGSQPAWEWKVHSHALTSDSLWPFVPSTHSSLGSHTHIHQEQYLKWLRYDSLLLFRVQQKETRVKKTLLSPFLSLVSTVSLSLSVCLPAMQPLNSAAYLVISSLGQTENERWGWVPLPLYAPDCHKSPPQRSHLHAEDLMNYRGLFMPLKARWVTTL